MPPGHNSSLCFAYLEIKYVTKECAHSRKSAKNLLFKKFMLSNLGVTKFVHTLVFYISQFFPVTHKMHWLIVQKVCLVF